MDEQIEFSARASLVALGLRMQRMGVWTVIAEHVAIKVLLMDIVDNSALPV
jgi:hypothetical protein